MIPNTPLRLATGVALAAFGLAACTTAPTATTPATSAAPTSASPSVSATPTASATPTPTLDADQAAALQSAESYESALVKIRANPSKFDQYKMIALLRPLAFDDMIQANLNGIRSWRDKGWHEEGQQVILSRQAGLPDAMANGTRRVSVTICKDQRQLIVVDRNGKKVTAEAAQGPNFLKNTYDMRRPKGADSFRVYEFGGDEVEGCQP